MDACFLVGCPRSGTTLLQAMLAQHPRIFTFPETHYFQKILGRLSRFEGSGFVSPRAAARTLDSLAYLLKVDRPSIPRWWLGAAKYRRSFAPLVEASASQERASMWIEKSPIHLHHIPAISASVPDARFVHLLRDGRDVVASLVDACRSDPDRWAGQLLGRRSKSTDSESIIKAATSRWNQDVRISVSYSGEPDHLLMTYESLIEDAEGSLVRLCRFLGLRYDSSMTRPWESAALVTGWRGSLPHMARLFGPLEDRRLQLFQSLFDANEQAAIVDLLDTPEFLAHGQE